MPVTGSDLVAQTLARLDVDTFFFLMGAPMLGAEKACLDRGMRGIDVRHEQAAAMMAHAYARVANRTGVCMACSGPGTINLVSGLATAFVDCAPVVALGGSSPLNEWGTGGFQEIDQVAIARPMVKWAERCYETRRIPELIDLAFRTAWAGKPGPVYLDLPTDVLLASIDEATVVWPKIMGPQRTRALADPAAVEAAIALLAAAEKPVVLSGSGVLWSDAATQFQTWIETSGMPFYTTPQGRGVVPEDHPLCFSNARSTALKEADAILVVGTRVNYVFGHLRPPRFRADAKVVRVDIDPGEIATTQRLDVGLVGDARAVLDQLTTAARGRVDPAHHAEWCARLRVIHLEKQAGQERELATDQVPIHPLRLCREVRDFMPRAAILCVDGQEILNYGRQSIPTHVAGHRLNSGPFGTMGVGLPFGLGAKMAKPDTPVIVLHGDGAFGLNGMELDTALRHRIPVLVVISLNGGWTGDAERKKPGRELGYTRFDQMAVALGGHGEYVERPEDIRPALERAQRAVDAGRTAVVNVVTDYRARAATVRFSQMNT
ncbi:MAG: thiamine pyrophosphate-binding protein [Proteobacteria bacterium]|nr:thiamine pyrophosphate-binding protein [Burkholderiales bacterium]